MNFQSDSIRDRAAMYRAIRTCLDSAGFMETDTPYLTPAPIPESHIELFRADRLHPDGGTSPLYLVPSPEVWLKLLLASGAPSLYQIGRCFRNGEQMDRWHRLEFAMLEWYALSASAEDNIPEMQRILEVCVEALRPDAPRQVSAPILRMRMEEAFVEFAGFSLESDLRNAGLGETGPSHPGYPAALEGVRSTLASRLKENGLPGGENERADDLFHRLFLTLVEQSLPTESPLILTHWPILVPTLARTIPGTPWAERWELYIAGVEVANCYGEETDLASLEAYWKAESALKLNAGVPVESGSEWPLQVARGMPSCSGAAVGLDRLLALIRGDEGLQGLDLFPIHDIMPR